MTGASNHCVQIDFCTLGMFIIDEIHFPAPRPAVFDVLGGAGSYSALGARLFSPPPLSKSVAWIVDAGTDFPAAIRQTIDKWDTSCLLRETPERLTTRGWNEYGANENRAFRYLTPKLRLDATSCSALLIQSKCFHLICSPLRCIEQVKALLARRAQEYPDLPRPLFVWEPVPDVCTPQELENCRQALSLVDVASPNHAEIAFFFEQTGEIDGEVDRAAAEQHAHDWLATGIGPTGLGGIVIRCGKEGCFVANKSISRWIPAYHNNASNVVDPTGGGNAFLGGLAVGLTRGESLSDAAVWGSVAAGFAIEQIGVPNLEYQTNQETWNGETVQDRLQNFMSRLSANA